MVARCPVVLHGLCHCLDPVLIEPLPEALVGTDYSSGLEMVGLPVHCQAGIVISRYGIDHIPVHIIVLRQFQALRNDVLHVVPPMRRIEAVVSRNYLCFNVLS